MTEAFQESLATLVAEELALARASFNWRMEDDPRPLLDDLTCLACAARALRISRADVTDKLR